MHWARQVTGQTEGEGGYCPCAPDLRHRGLTAGSGSSSEAAELEPVSAGGENLKDTGDNKNAGRE
jgi:hypothetical protein